MGNTSQKQNHLFLVYLAKSAALRKATVEGTVAKAPKRSLVGTAGPMAAIAFLILGLATFAWKMKLQNMKAAGGYRDGLMV